MDEFQQKKLEKELSELKKLIDLHFVQRKKDEEELKGLEDRIEKRKEYRAAQLAERARVRFSFSFPHGISFFRGSKKKKRVSKRKKSEKKRKPSEEPMKKPLERRSFFRLSMQLPMEISDKVSSRAV